MTVLIPTSSGPGDEYKRLVEDMPVMLWTADAIGRWTHVNTRWIEYTGLVGEASGFGFEAELHPEDVAPTLAIWRAAIATEQNYDIEYRLRNQQGQYRWFMVSGRKRKGTPDDDVVWVGTCSDIDQQKWAEQQAVESQRAAVRALGLALGVRDGETGEHTDRVTALALRLGRMLNLSEEELAALEVGVLLHDVGKLSIPDQLLLKPSQLTRDERMLMETHAALGERFAAALGFVSPAALSVIRHHHERWNGRGYPDQLSGEQIPLLARIFAVVDVYDALVSQRPYKVAWSPLQAYEEIEQQSGEHFDPRVATVFLSLQREMWAEGTSSGHEAM